MIDLSNQEKNNRLYNIGFSIAGSIIIILFFIFINFSTGMKFPWFIFPSYAVLWWPILMIFTGRRSMKVLSLIGSLITIALLIVTNYITSWNYPWFIFPSFAVILWPIGTFLGTNHKKVFSIFGSIALIAVFISLNYLSSPSVIWFYYPAFAVIWWPLSEFLAGPRTSKEFSVIGSLLIIAFLIAENMIETPQCPWSLLAILPVLMWPAGVLFGKYFGKLITAILSCSACIIYYVILNMFVFKGFPWAIFPAYALIWWPVAIAFAKQGHSLIFSIVGSLLSAVFFITTNIITSPHIIWAIYPIFALIWWPLSVYYFVYRRKKVKNA